MPATVAAAPMPAISRATALDAGDRLEIALGVREDHEDLDVPLYRLRCFLTYVEALQALCPAGPSPVRQMLDLRAGQLRREIHFRTQRTSRPLSP